MNAKDIVTLVCERKAPAPHWWTHSRGIYADLSKWPGSIDYYVECPECKHVHGFYKSFKEALSKRLCPTCDLERTEKLKKDVRKVAEAEEPPGPDDPDDIDYLDPKEEVERYMEDNWIFHAQLQLENELRTHLELNERDSPCEDVDPDLCSCVVFDDESTDDYGHSQQWRVWKSEEIAEAEALEQVENDLRTEPENFNQGWLVNFINMDRLRNFLYTDQINFTREDFDDQYPDYEDKVQALISSNDLEEGEFLDEEGDIKPETPELSAKVDSAEDTYVKRVTDERLENPMDYLNEIYGEDAQKQAMEWGGLDVQAAAKNAIATDGWQHFLSRYDGKSIDLPGGAVAVREG